MPRTGVSVGRAEQSAAAQSEQLHDESWLEEPLHPRGRHLRAVPDRLDPEILELWERKVAGEVDLDARERRSSRPSAGSDVALEPPPRRQVAAAGETGPRTVTIQGRGAERAMPRSRHRPQRPPHERSGFRPDRTALYAVLLGLILILAAATSAHAAQPASAPQPLVQQVASP